MSAVYRYFMPCWGTYGENGFSRIPDSLRSLKPSLSKKEKFLGGTYDLNLKVYRETDGDEEWNIAMQHRIGGRKSFFETKSNNTAALMLTTQLNGKRKLIEALEGLDLIDLTICKKNSRLELCLTPYGGGLCFLLLPPLRYTVPLPPEQRNRMTWALEQLAKLIGF
jgi:hypothetical protein